MVKDQTQGGRRARASRLQEREWEASAKGGGGPGLVCGKLVEEIRWPCGGVATVLLLSIRCGVVWCSVVCGVRSVAAFIVTKKTPLDGKPHIKQGAGYVENLLRMKSFCKNKKSLLPLGLKAHFKCIITVVLSIYLCGSSRLTSVTVGRENRCHKASKNVGSATNLNLPL